MTEDESRAATEELFRRLADADGGDGPLAWEAWDGSSATVGRGGRRFLLGVAEVTRPGTPGRRGREVLASVRRLSPLGVPEGPEVLVTPAASAVLAVALPEAPGSTDALRRLASSHGWRVVPGTAGAEALAEAMDVLRR
jgi:hypothetical protein